MNRSFCAYLFACLVGLPFLAIAQQNIRGRITDSATRKPVPYVTITLLNSKKEIVSNTFSNEEGGFKLQIEKPETLTLEVTSVGYAIRELSIKPTSNNIDIGEILLATTGTGLTEVTVTARKKLIELRPGMLVYNAENDISNKGNTAADVLRKTPILNVDAQGNVTMRGSANLKILINGKYSGQIARSPADALNMIPAENIKSVEVITTPSAKYDAEGAAGVINIITKKGYRDLNGALELSLGNMEQMFNPRISAVKDKWNFSLHGHLHRLRRKENVINNRTQFENDTTSLLLSQFVEKDNAAPHGSVDIVVGYTPDSATEITYGMNLWFGRWPDNSNINTTVKAPDGSVQEQYLQTLKSHHGYLSSDINLSVNRKLKRPGQEITFLAQFSPSSGREPYKLLQSDMHSEPFYAEENSNNIRNREWTLQLDYVHPLSKTFSIESGAKLIARKVSNEYRVVAGEPGSLEPVDDRSDRFDYTQHVAAGYLMLKANLDGGWYAEGGARHEYTDYNGEFEQAAGDFKSNFSNFVPTATISKKISEDHHLALSYTQRITRPYVWDLSPNTNAGDPKNIETGNPDLEPEIAHQVELTYGWNKGAAFFLNSSLFWKKTGDAIVDFTTTDAEGVSTTMKQNLAGNTTMGLNFSSSVTISPSWSVNGNLNINHLEYNSDALRISREGWAADIDVNTTIRMQRNYSLQVFADYNSRSVSMQGFRTYNYYYAFAAKKNLPEQKLTLTLSAVNPFSSYVPQSVIKHTADFYSVAENRFFSRAVKFTVNWEFGGASRSRERKKVSNDDVNSEFRQ
ncbi:MAG: TonB-dependent receptor [Chitinophagaceae bacterium]|nr:TonB-dependent receptor [Chitinophagaceae bacterium]